MADFSPIDPHALFASGGDADPIGSGATIVLSTPPGAGNNGGGIFVFNNDTGKALSAVEVDITLPVTFGPFFFTGTIFTPGGGAASVSAGVTFHGCGNPSDLSDFCVDLVFAVNPGPLVPINGNFVLDFDKPTSQGPPPVYGSEPDSDVANGTYAGETDTSDARVGEWSDGAVGTVTPIFATPEPRQYAGLLAGIFALAMVLKRKRFAVAQ